MRVRASDPAPRDAWLAVPERGSAGLLWLMAAFSLRFGRRASRGILRVATAYFLLFAPRAGRASRAYLRRVLGREPRLRERYRHLFYFATTIHDRMFIADAHDDPLCIAIEGAELMHAQQATGRGAILLGAHLGSFEIVGMVGRRIPGVRVAMAMYEENAGKLPALLAALGRKGTAQIVPLGKVNSMLRIAECIDSGEFVGILADRSFGTEARQPVRLLGEAVGLPTGPMRIAAALGCPVIFIAGLYRGANRYQVVFEKVADFAGVHGAARRSAIEAAIERYASLLEAHVRRDPYNWFNFYDFWRSPDAAQPR